MSMRKQAWKCIGIPFDRSFRDTSVLPMNSDSSCNENHGMIKGLAGNVHVPRERGFWPCLQVPKQRKVCISLSNDQAVDNQMGRCSFYYTVGPTEEGSV